MLGLHCCVVVVYRGYSLVAVRELLIAVASLVGAQALGHSDFRSCGLSDYVLQALEHRLSSCGAQA